MNQKRAGSADLFRILDTSPCVFNFICGPWDYRWKLALKLNLAHLQQIILSMNMQCLCGEGKLCSWGAGPED